MNENLTGVWRGVITNEVSSVTLATVVATFGQEGTTLFGTIILKEVLPPSSKEEIRSLRGNFLGNVEFTVVNTPIGDVLHSGSLSEDGKKLSGCWQARAHLYRSNGRFELVRDVPTDPAESIETVKNIKVFAPV